MLLGLIATVMCPLTKMLWNHGAVHLLQKLTRMFVPLKAGITTLVWALKRSADVFAQVTVATLCLCAYSMRSASFFFESLSCGHALESAAHLSGLPGGRWACAHGRDPIGSLQAFSRQPTAASAALGNEQMRKGGGLWISAQQAFC